MNKHEPFMRRALELALRGEGKVEPNPMVGAVVVRGGRIVGEGYHRRFGGAHAEPEALKKAGARAKGATLYVNLEPCMAFPGKKTPPCAERLAASGVKEVVVAMKDPHPGISGKGIRLLKKAGIRVVTGILEKEAAELNAPFIKFQSTRLPYVIAKWAMTLDGKIALASGDSKWITSAEARNHARRELRSRVQAIMVGSGTALRDNPSLSAPRGNPLRIVLDSMAHLPLDSKLVGTCDSQRTMVVVSTSAPEDRVRALRKAGCEIIRQEVMDLRVLLEVLAGEGIRKVLVEGGSDVHAAALEDGLVDEVWAFVAPRIAGGGDSKSPVGGTGVPRMSAAIPVENWEMEPIGRDVLLRGKILR